MKVLFVLLAVFLCSLPILVGAQEIEATEFYVSDVLFNEGRYEAGQTVDGTFVFHNLSTETLARAAYRVELVELLDDGNGIYPSDALDATAHVPLPVLQPGASKISFTYTLPAHVPNTELGLLIQTYLGDTNTPAALEYVPLVVTGDRVSYMERHATVVVNGQEFYDTLAGPTVENTETVVIEVAVNNTTAIPHTLQTSLQIVAGNTSTGSEVAVEQVPAVSISAGAAHILSIPVAVSTLNPGVYTLLVRSEYADSNKPAFAPIEARLVVAGLTPKIERVAYSTLDLVPEDASFDVLVSYLDTPINFRTYTDGTPKDDRVSWAAEEKTTAEWVQAMGLSARVELTDADTGELIQVQERVFDTVNSVNVSFGRIVGSTNINIRVILLQHGTEVDVLSETVTLQAQKYTGLNLLLHEYPIAVLGGGVALVSILVLLVGLLVLRRKRKSVQHEILG